MTREIEKSIRVHNQRTRINHEKFLMGDLNLVSKTLSERQHKLKVRWKVPLRIPLIQSEFSYELEDLINFTASIVHEKRLKLYVKRELEVAE